MVVAGVNVGVPIYLFGNLLRLQSLSLSLSLSLFRWLRPQWAESIRVPTERKNETPPPPPPKKKKEKKETNKRRTPQRKR